MTSVTCVDCDLASHTVDTSEARERQPSFCEAIFQSQRHGGQPSSQTLSSPRSHNLRKEGTNERTNERMLLF